MTCTRSASPNEYQSSGVSIRVIRPLVEAAVHAGVSRDALMREALMEPEILYEPDSRIPLARVYRIIAAILDGTGDPAFGLHLFEHTAARAFNPVADLVYHASDLRQSLRALQQFAPLLTDDLNIQIHEDGMYMRIEYVEWSDAPARVRRFIAEVVLSGLCRRIRAFSPNVGFHRVSFSHALPPDYGAQYARVFNDRAHFGQSFTGVVFERALLESRSPCADRELYKALSLFAERKLRESHRIGSYAERVRRYILQNNSPRHVDMTQVARLMKLSTRSLRRRLSVEGTTFVAISEAALASAAERYLVEGERSIQETAYELGFQDKAAFHRAFKRWTGSTPKVFLQRHASAQTNE